MFRSNLKTRFVICMIFAMFASQGFADSNIDPTNRYAVLGNAGWADWNTDPTDGVVIDETFCSGYIYSANCGWIHLGDGSPTNGTGYSNIGANDYGVNHDGYGNLSGYAYGANIGWIDFDTSGSGGSQVTYDWNGSFSGYAYSANMGWISMSGFTKSVALLDTDADGLPDLSETDTGIYMDPFHTGTSPSNTDADDDGIDDGEEIIAGIDPTNPDSDGDGFEDGWEVDRGWSPVTDDGDVISYIVARNEVFDLYSSNVVLNVAMGEILLEIPGTQATLSLQMEQSEDLQSWTPAGDAVEWSIPVDTNKQFFRVRSAP